MSLRGLLDPKRPQIDFLVCVLPQYRSKKTTRSHFLTSLDPKKSQAGCVLSYLGVPGGCFVYKHVSPWPPKLPGMLQLLTLLQHQKHLQTTSNLHLQLLEKQKSSKRRESLAQRVEWLFRQSVLQTSQSAVSSLSVSRWQRQSAVCQSVRWL